MTSIVDACLSEAAGKIMPGGSVAAYIVGHGFSLAAGVRPLNETAFGVICHFKAVLQNVIRIIDVLPGDFCTRRISENRFFQPLFMSLLTVRFFDDVRQADVRRLGDRSDAPNDLRNAVVGHFADQHAITVVLKCLAKLEHVVVVCQLRNGKVRSGEVVVDDLAA